MTELEQDLDQAANEMLAEAYPAPTPTVLAQAKREIATARIVSADAMYDKLTSLHEQAITSIKTQRTKCIEGLKAQLMQEQAKAQASLDRSQRAIEDAMAIAKSEAENLAATKVGIDKFTDNIELQVNEAEARFAKMIAAQKQALSVMNAIDA